MFPLKDRNPSSIRPYVTWSIIFVCIVIFIWQILGDSSHYEGAVMDFGLSPTGIIIEGAYYTFLSSMFLHANLLHLGGNMLYLYIFGDNVEDMCGHGIYIIFYLFCGVMASAIHIFTNLGSSIPAIGASGAISGVLGAYIVLFPRAKILTAIPLFFFIRIIWVPAYIMIGIWFVYQFTLAFLGSGSSVAYWAHIGGFVAGLVFIRVFARRRYRHPLYKIY